MSIRFVLLVVLFSLASTSFAQQRERASASFLAMGDAGLDGQPGAQLGLRETEVSSGYPV